jgi:hypothetical protein
LFTFISRLILTIQVAIKAFISVIGLALTATAAPASELAARDPWEVAFYANGDCSGSVIYQNLNMEPGNCYNTNAGPAYGGFLLDVFNNHPGCKFKNWELPNCHGKATVQSESISCVPIANKDGQFYVTDGIRSVQIIC